MEKFYNVLEKPKTELPRLDDTRANELINRFITPDFRESLHEPFNDEDVLHSIFRLVLELAPKLTEYNTVIGDDASGRLLALLLHKVISKKTKNSNLASPNIYFVSAGKHEGRGEIATWENIGREIEKFLETKKDTLGKTLLVTEYITTGKTIKKMELIFNKLGIDFDIASLSIYGRQKYLFPELRDKLYFGDAEGRAGRFIYGNRNVANVQKKDIRKTEDLSAHTSKYTGYSKDQGKANTARIDIEVIANKLLEILEADDLNT